MASKYKHVAQIEMPRVSLDEFEENILQLQELCAQDGATMVIIMPPVFKWHYWLRKAHRIREVMKYLQRLKQTAKAHAIPYFSIVEMDKSGPKDFQPYFHDTVHPAYEGHAIIMQRLYKFLTSRGLVF